MAETAILDRRRRSEARPQAVGGAGGGGLGAGGAIFVADGGVLMVDGVWLPGGRSPGAPRAVTAQGRERGSGSFIDGDTIVTLIAEPACRGGSEVYRGWQGPGAPGKGRRRSGAGTVDLAANNTFMGGVQ